MEMFDSAIFDSAIFDTGAQAAVERSAGGFDREQAHHALHFFDRYAPHAQKAAQEVVERAASIERHAPAPRESAHVAQMALLRAEFLALAETKQMRDQAREMFAVLVADEAERQDAQAAFMALMVSML